MAKLCIQGLIATALVAVAVGLGSCGGGGMPSNAVAVVDGMPITKAALDHWTSVEFVTDDEQQAQHAVPSGLIPKPPYYTACIERQRSLEAGSHATTAQLKSQCEQHYRAVREHVLNVLIVFDWYTKEGEKQGVTPKDSEVKHEYKRFKSERFQHPGDFQRYLAHTGEGFDDELLRMKMDLLTTRLAAVELNKLGGSITSPAQQRAYAKWGEDFVKDWVGRTSCRTGYVVPNCKQYKGSSPPDPRI
jgi:hypothetical protein